MEPTVTPPETPPPEKWTPEYFKWLGSRGGSARAKKFSRHQRSAWARQGGKRRKCKACNETYLMPKSICPNCGASVKRRCRRCGAPYVAPKKKCPHCGKNPLTKRKIARPKDMSRYCNFENRAKTPTVREFGRPRCWKEVHFAIPEFFAPVNTSKPNDPRPKRGDRTLWACKGHGQQWFDKYAESFPLPPGDRLRSPWLLALKLFGVRTLNSGRNVIALDKPMGLEFADEPENREPQPSDQAEAPHGNDQEVGPGTTEGS